MTNLFLLTLIVALLWIKAVRYAFLILTAFMLALAIILFGWKGAVGLLLLVVS